MAFSPISRDSVPGIHSAVPQFTKDVMASAMLADRSLNRSKRPNGRRRLCGARAPKAAPTVKQASQLPEGDRFRFPPLLHSVFRAYIPHALMSP